MSKQRVNAKDEVLPEWRPLKWEEGAKLTVVGTPLKQDGTVSDPGFTIGLYPEKNEEAPDVSFILHVMFEAPKGKNCVEMYHMVKGEQKDLKTLDSPIENGKQATVVITFWNDALKVELNGKAYKYPNAKLPVTVSYVHGDEFQCESIFP